MDNATRRQLLQRHRQSGFPGSIIDVYKAYDQGIDLIGQFEQQQELQKPSVASTPQEQEAGLRPAHQAGNVNQSMVFPNVSPNASFNTVGMKAPIDIKQFSPQGNLVRSFDAVPPGVTNLKMGSEGGMVLETPAQMKSGGVRKYQWAGPIDNTAVATPPPPQYQLNPYPLLPHYQLPQTPYRDQGTIRPVPRSLDYETWREDDSLIENAIEFFDPTGISSWDDARRAYNSMQQRGASYPNLDEGLDMFGAVPLVGKFRRGINLGKGAAKHIGDIKNLGVSAYNALTRGADVINRVDAIEDETGFLNSKKNGGVRKYQWAGPRIDGPRVPALSDAEMSAKILQEANAGNPAARRMRSDYGQRMFLPGETDPSTHYMASFDNYAVPTVQEDYIGGPLSYNPNPAPSKADFRFNTPEQAAYFAKNYKQASAAKTFQQKNGGIRKYQKGNPPKQAIAGAEPTPLEWAAADQLAVMANPEMLGDAYLHETDPRASYYIDNELMNLTARPWFTSQSTGNGPAWSAGTVSNLMRAQYPDFPDTVAHADYVNDVFEGPNGANLNARRTSLQRHFNEGSVLVRGRNRLQGENYHGLKNATTGREYQENKNSSIPLHGDVIIGVVTDKKGKKRYQVQGGNIGDSLFVTEMSEKEIKRKYPMVLEQRFGGKRTPTKVKDRRKNLYRK